MFVPEARTTVKTDNPVPLIDGISRLFIDRFNACIHTSRFVGANQFAQKPAFVLKEGIESGLRQADPIGDFFDGCPFIALADIHTEDHIQYFSYAFS